jgi:hypothetical protein
LTDSSRPVGLHPLALDVSSLVDVPPDVRPVLETVSRAIEEARARLQQKLGNSRGSRGFAPKPVDVFEQMTWEDLLLKKPEVANYCTAAISQADQKKKVVDLLSLILKYCAPLNDMAFFWMWLCYKRGEDVIILSEYEIGVMKKKVAQETRISATRKATEVHMERSMKNKVIDRIDIYFGKMSMAKAAGKIAADLHITPEYVKSILREKRPGPWPVYKGHSA